MGLTAPGQSGAQPDGGSWGRREWCRPTEPISRAASQAGAVGLAHPDHVADRGGAPKETAELSSLEEAWMALGSPCTAFKHSPGGGAQ